MDPLLLVPMLVGAVMIGVLLLELGLGKIGFMTKGLGLQYDPNKKLFELSAGPVVGVIVVGAILVVAPIVIDTLLVSKKTYYLSGTVKAENRQSSRDIRIIACYPLTDPEEDGKFSEVKMFKNEVGKFPKVAFELAGYASKTVTINDENVNRLGSDLELKETITLREK